MTPTTLERAAALSRAADQEARRLREVRAIERVAGPLTFPDDMTIETVREAHGAMPAVLAAVADAFATEPAASAD